MKKLFIGLCLFLSIHAEEDIDINRLLDQEVTELEFTAEEREQMAPTTLSGKIKLRLTTCLLTIGSSLYKAGTTVCAYCGCGPEYGE